MTLLDKSDALEAADKIIEKYGAAPSYESFREMLALAFTTGAVAGFDRAIEIYERKVA